MDFEVLKRSVNTPPICSVLRSKTDFIVINNLHKELQDALSRVTVFFSNVDTECKILQRIIYKQMKQFRREKLLAAFKLIHKLYIRLKAQNFEKYVKDLVGIITESSGSRIPSSTMMTFTLQLIYRVAVVLQSMLGACVLCYTLIENVLGLGHFISNMLLYSAIIGRIWFTSRAMLKFTIDLYTVVTTAVSTTAIWAEVLKSESFRADINDLLPKDSDFVLSTAIKKKKKKVKSLIEGSLEDSEEFSKQCSTGIHLLDTLRPENLDCSWKEDAFSEDIGEMVSRKRLAGKPNVQDLVTTGGKRKKSGKNDQEVCADSRTGTKSNLSNQRCDDKRIETTVNFNTVNHQKTLKPLKPTNTFDNLVTNSVDIAIEDCSGDEIHNHSSTNPSNTSVVDEKSGKLTGENSKKKKKKSREKQKVTVAPTTSKNQESKQEVVNKELVISLKSAKRTHINNFLLNTLTNKKKTQRFMDKLRQEHSVFSFKGKKKKMTKPSIELKWKIIRSLQYYLKVQKEECHNLEKIKCVFQGAAQNLMAVLRPKMRLKMAAKEERKRESK